MERVGVQVSVLIIVGIFLCIGIYLCIRGQKQYNKTYSDILLQEKERIAVAVKQEKEDWDELVNECEAQRRKLDSLKLEASLIQSSTDKLIESEQRRVESEFKRQKELEEVKFTQEKERKQQQLELYIARMSEECKKDYEQKKEKMQKEIDQLQSKLDEFQAMSTAVNEAILHKKELEEREDFYSVQISDEDKDDIKVLQSMDLRLHNRNVLPKLIWDLFVRRPVQEMIKRVLAGRETTSGIYKVTNKQTGESYIGRSSNIGTRWQNHCKTAIGLESAASSTFHTRLAKDGLWNYTWEVLEEVPKEKLSEREAFYIDLYGTKQQMNMRAGG